MKFEWNPRKENINIQKHGIAFDKASYVFADPYALNKYDEEYSQEEDRWLLLGKSMNEVILAVVHTFNDQDSVERVRIINARKATKNESKEYQRRCQK